MNEHDFSSTEAALTRAFESRHGAAPSSRPSLADVRRRARRRTSRRASLRVGAGLAVGTAAVAGTWVVTRTDGGRSATAGPVTPASEGDSGTGESPTTRQRVVESELSNDALWEAVANHLGTPLEELKALNPDVDFTQPPTPGMSLRHLEGAVIQIVPCGWQVVSLSTVVAERSGIIPGERPPVSVPDLPTTTFDPSVTFPTTTVPPDLVPTPVTASVELVPCSPETTSSLPTETTAPPPIETTTAPESPDTTAPIDVDMTVAVPGSSVAPGEIYSVQSGDTLFGIARQHCTTADAIVAINGWPDGIETPLSPGMTIVVPNSC